MLFNSSLVRYVDLLDSYMAIGGLCHPSDNFGTILAAAEQVGASGEEFMLALAVAYEIQCRSRIIGAVERLDASEVSDLTYLLSQVLPIAVFPTAHPGIQ